MENNQESITKKGKRPKSATRYPKRIPTYVVAFAVQESHDDPPKVANKRSINSTPSSKSVSTCGSTVSAKTFVITPTEKLSHVLDIPTISEVKIDIIDENQCGDAEKKSPQMSNYLVVDNRMVDEQPEIIFNASKHVKRCKDNNKFTRKKPRKNKRVIKFKNVHFKYKNPKNNISRRLEKYYEKAKMKSPNAEIQKQIYSNVLSKVVSRSRVLKKVLAKENLLDDADRISFYEGMNFNDYDDGSANSSPSTTKKSFISYASQNTLVRKSSSSSRNDDFYSIKTANSVIQVSSDITPVYKTDVINVAVAVAYSTSKQNSNTVTESSDETFMHKENLTSDETFITKGTELTSKTPSGDANYLPKAKINYEKLNLMNLNAKEQSSVTLTLGKNSAMGVCSDEDTFVIARTSSDFNKSSINNSEFTITSNSDSTMRGDIDANLLSKDEFNYNTLARPTLIDKVRNLGFYPEMTPSTSSDVNGDINDVIITGPLKKSFPIGNPDNFPTDLKIDISNILKKSFEVEKLACPKNICLPNDIAIKAKLIEAEKSQRRTCSEEVRNKYPTDICEMWEKLTLVLDLALKRLEETLAEKIVNDIKASLAVLNQQEYLVPNLEIQQNDPAPTPASCERPIPVMLHKEVFILEDHLKADADKCVQCDLVQNQVIDQLMLKLSVEGPVPTPAVSLKKLERPEIVKEYFEILKPPATESAIIELGKGDMVTVSTATADMRTEEFRGMDRMKLLFTGPMAFIRENMFIITSVPTFFIVLLCLYGIIVIIIKPW